MGNKYLKLITSCLSLTATIPLAACSTIKQEDQTQETLDSILILSDIKNIRLEKNETYLSNPIETKCYSQTKKEMQVKTQLILLPLDKNNIDIELENNQIKIGQQKEVGTYKYKIVAISEDMTVLSNIKEFSVEIYKSAIIPDHIEIAGLEKLSLEYPSNKTFNYELIAKSEGKIIEEYDARTEYEINITSSSSGKTKDIFDNPIFSLKQENKQFILNCSKNLDKSYQGDYELEINVSLLSNPNVTTTKHINITLIYGLEYIDRANNYVYSRDSVESNWSLNSIPSTSHDINKNKLLKQINNYGVNRIGNNFCSNSGIKTFINFDTPVEIKSIGSYAFYKQEALSSLYIENIEGVGTSAFEGCPLAVINPQWQLKLKYVDNCAFKDCIEFEPKFLPDIVYLGDSCFRGIGSSEIHFGNKLSLIGSEVLYDCPKLKDIYICASTPPYLMGDFVGGCTPTSYKIHVPIDAIDSYRNDQNWSNYSQNLVGDIIL